MKSFEKAYQKLKEMHESRFQICPLCEGGRVKQFFDRLFRRIPRMTLLIQKENFSGYLCKRCGLNLAVWEFGNIPLYPYQLALAKNPDPDEAMKNCVAALEWFLEQQSKLDGMQVFDV